VNWKGACYFPLYFFCGSLARLTHRKFLVFLAIYNIGHALMPCSQPKNKQQAAAVRVACHVALWDDSWRCWQ
jgi:hypothetical protein